MFADFHYATTKGNTSTPTKIKKNYYDSRKFERLWTFRHFTYYIQLEAAHKIPHVPLLVSKLIGRIPFSSQRPESET